MSPYGALPARGPNSLGGSLLLLSLATAVSGCSSSDYSRRAQRGARNVLEVRSDEVLGSREATARHPEPRTPPPEEEPSEQAPPPPEPQPELVLDLREALAIAYLSNRQMIDRRDLLEGQALSLLSVRHGFAPQVALALRYAFDHFADDVIDAVDTNAAGADLLLTQILPTGATLSVNAGTTGAAEAGDPGSGVYGSSASLRLSQPLLRGGGYDVTHEPLIQAERNLVYDIREYERFREDFSIDVARRFYGLVNQKQSIDNQRQNLDNNEFGRRQAEALFAVGRANELDVLRARRRELTARKDMLEAEEGLLGALDGFRIFLGLPEDQPIDVEPDPPSFVAVDYDERSATEVALENRLDLRNRREQLEDAERSLRLAGNALLPDLDLELSAAYAGAQTDVLGGAELEYTGSSVAVTLGVPIDRVRERNAYRAAELLLARNKRSLEEFEDQLQVEIRSSFRELERRLQSLEIQRQLIEDQTKNVRIAELRFERGELPNRDVVEANQSLLDAQNALIDEQVNYEIARLELLRDLGILFVGEDGMWKQ